MRKQNVQLENSDVKDELNKYESDMKQDTINKHKHKSVIR